MAAYTWAIEDALGKAGLQIPYKQMDLHLRSVFDREGDEGLRAMGLKQTRPTAPKTAAVSTANDAADDLEAARSRDIARAQKDAVSQGLEDDDEDEIG